MTFILKRQEFIWILLCLEWNILRRNNNLILFLKLVQ